MAVLKDFICMDCSEEFDDFHTEETVCKKCGSKNLKVQIKSIRIHQSDGNFANKVPNGFKSVLSGIHKSAGKQSRIDTFGISEV